MSKYAYQIQGALENDKGKFCGFRVLVCNAYNFGLADAPVELFDNETSKYIEFRLKLTDKFDIRKLPYIVEKNIRVPLGNWLDQWVLDNFYGNPSKPKNPNVRLLENSQRSKTG